MICAVAICIHLVFHFFFFTSHFLDTRPFFFTFIGDLCKIPRGVIFDLYRGTVRYWDESLRWLARTKIPLMWDWGWLAICK